MLTWRSKFGITIFLVNMYCFTSQTISTCTPLYNHFELITRTVSPTFGTSRHSVVYFKYFHIKLVLFFVNKGSLGVTRCRHIRLTNHRAKFSNFQLYSHRKVVLLLYPHSMKYFRHVLSNKNGIPSKPLVWFHL